MDTFSPKLRTLAGNNLWLLAGTGLSVIAGLAANYVNSRYLGVAIFGEYSLLLSVVSLTGIVGGSAGTILLKSSARGELSLAELMIAGASIHIVASGAIMLIVMPAGIAFIGDAHAIIPAVCMAVAAMVSSSTGALISIHSGKNQMQWQMLKGIEVLSAAILLLGLTLLSSNLGLFGSALATLSAALVVWAGAYLYAICKVGKLCLPSGWVMKKIVIASLALSVVPLTQLVYYQLDLWLTEWFSTPLEVGILGAAFRLVGIMRQAVWIMVMGALPIMLAETTHSYEALKQTLNSSLGRLIFLGSLVTTSLIAASEIVIAVLYPSEFSKASDVFCIYALAFVPMLIHWLSMNALFVSGRTITLGLPYITVSLVEVVAASWVVPRYGAMGMAVVRVMGESLTATAFLAMLLRARLLKPDKRIAFLIGWIVLVYSIVYVMTDVPRWMAGLLGVVALMVGGLLVSGVRWRALSRFF